MACYRHGVLAGILLGALWSGAAFAQQQPAPAAPALPIPPISQPEPSASQLAAARDVVIASGMSRSFTPMVPQLREQIVPMLTRTRPDLTKDLTEVLVQLGPEFDKKTDDMIDIAARIYSRRMSEEELKQTATFFNSPVGKKYVGAQPEMLDELVVSMQSWTQQLSNYMMTRVRQEVQKRGKDF